MPKEKEKQHTLTIRLPHSIWLQLRRAQEEGLIRSIQDAVVRALKQYL